MPKRCTLERMRDSAWMSIMAGLLALAPSGCVTPKTELVRPPAVAWHPLEQPLAHGVTADGFYLAAVQIMAERGLVPQFDHPAAHTLVSSWIPTAPPVLFEAKPSQQTAGAPAPLKRTNGVAQFAIVVTVQSGTARIDIRCRERVPVALGVVPSAFTRCQRDQRPPIAVEAAKSFADEAMMRAPLLPPGPSAPPESAP